MSDFFNDDFTAELKSYYLNSLLKEIEKFIDLVDESTLKRLRIEICEQCESWVVDAKSNDFLFLAEWLHNCASRMDAFAGPADLILALRTAHKYVETLLQSPKDTPELAAMFAISSELQGESLYLHCRIGVQEFVIPVKNVVEVIGALEIFPLPDHRPGLQGVIPYRGEVIAVYNLQEFGFQNNDGPRSFFVICDYEGTPFALQVSETDELMNLKDRDLQSLESNSIVNSIAFVHNFIVKDQRNIMILDIEKLVAA